MGKPIRCAEDADGALSHGQGLNFQDFQVSDIMLSEKRYLIKWSYIVDIYICLSYIYMLNICWSLLIIVENKSININ
jgi:hypothetical protein